MEELVHTESAPYPSGDGIRDTDNLHADFGDAAQHCASRGL